jgi:AbrB family looped-hinge helix DNA binding protein
MYNMDTPQKKHIELAGTVTVGPKGQVVIPSDVREKMQIHPGDKLVALYMPAKQSVGFVSESQIQSLIDKMGASVTDLQSVLKK